MAEIYSFSWREIEIALHYAELFRNTHEKHGFALAKIHIKANGPLPIALKGSLLHYVASDYLDQFTNPVEYIKALLEQEANSPEWLASISQWKKPMAPSMQLDLF
jgi:hypothetical protein